MTAPAKPTLVEQIAAQKKTLATAKNEEWHTTEIAMAEGILATLEAYKRITEAAGRPEPTPYVKECLREGCSVSDGTAELVAYIRSLTAYADQAELDAETARMFTEAAERQLAELQAEHDALVKRLREPSNKLLSDMMYAWEHSFGTPYTRYKSMLNVAVDAAMSAVALKGGE